MLTADLDGVHGEQRQQGVEAVRARLLLAPAPPVLVSRPVPASVVASMEVGGDASGGAAGVEEAARTHQVEGGRDQHRRQQPARHHRPGCNIQLELEQLNIDYIPALMLYVLLFRYASEMKGLQMHLSIVAPVRPVLLVVGMCATVAGQSRKLSSYLQLLISDGWSTAATGHRNTALSGRVSGNVSHPDTSSREIMALMHQV